ncbi:metal-dependent hydrolase [Paenibacillus flagellatus]|uniref:Hydrolase n=1 Tax=Paenibacillus flagellatus TaxID=2211139 RepID=A0A2V5JVM8_9BACL|nr:metal-dependent hydrolase [Paenibacillus flagellatus]PYI50795.1 hydrolase [Paenibacillus flagellatus]
MDTGTHLVVGLGLAGLAYVDPAVASDPALATAVLIGTVLGSQAPDSDGLLRFRSNAAYIRNHRGKSHSLPAVAIWTVLITLVLAVLFRGVSVVHLGLWVFIAVALHVFSDLFNTYGTQAFRPITDKWISWNIIHIFDPIIFSTHLIAIFLWSVRLAPPAQLFLTLYGLLAIYYAWRTLVHANVSARLKLQDPHYQPDHTYILIPTIHLYVWNVVKRTKPDHYTIGEFRGGKLRWVDQVRCEQHPAIDASKEHPDVQAFLYFTSTACAEAKEHSWGYEVRWTDVRYRHRKQYPFVAVVLMDKQFRPIDSYVGWRSEGRVEKKLKISTY